MNSGYIYVMSNESMPGLVKIGRANRAPDERALELNSTGVPKPFQVDYQILVEDTVSIERQIHQLLESQGFRTSNQREFFQISVDDAIAFIETITNQSSSTPDFTLSHSLAKLCDSIQMPYYDAEITREESELLEKRLSELGRKGYPYALKMLAEVFERNYKSSLKFREYWQEYLELSKLEADFWGFQPSSNGLDVRDEIGKGLAEYLEYLAKHKWLTTSDFDFSQRFLLAGDQFIYEGYVVAIKRADLPDEIRCRALDL